MRMSRGWLGSVNDIPLTLEIRIDLSPLRADSDSND